MTVPRLDGLQLIHAHNHTLAVRECHMTFNTSKLLYHLDADTTNIDYISYRNLKPGCYIANVNGINLAFVLYQPITHGDELIIKSRNNIFSIHNLAKYKIIPYILNMDLEYMENGHNIKRAVHDSLEVFITKGYTEYQAPINVYNQGFIKTNNSIIIRTQNNIGTYDYPTINLKTPINNIDDKVYDIIYVDRYLNKTMYQFNLGRLIFSGEEPWVQLDNGIFYYNATEPHEYGSILCNSYNTIEYNDIINFSSTNYGICAGPKERRGFYIRSRPEEPQTLDDFINLLRYNYENNKAINLIYQLDKPLYRIFPLAEKIQLPYKNGYMSILTDVNRINVNTDIDINRNKYNIYFYNHLKGVD